MATHEAPAPEPVEEPEPESTASNDDSSGAESTAGGLSVSELLDAAVTPINSSAGLQDASALALVNIGTAARLREALAPALALTDTAAQLRQALAPTLAQSNEALQRIGESIADTLDVRSSFEHILSNLLAEQRAIIMRAAAPTLQLDLSAVTPVLTSNLSVIFGTQDAFRSLTHINDILMHHTEHVSSQSLRALADLSQHQVNLAGWAATTTRHLLTGPSELSLRSWREVVTTIDSELNETTLHVATASGHAVLGLVGADLLTSDDRQGPTLETIERVEHEALAPHDRARLDTAAQLRSVLGRFDSTAPLFINEAWNDLHAGSPLSAEKVAYDVTELIDRTIRAAAPDEEMEPWLPTSGVPESQWRSDRGNLTRAMRLRYIATTYGGDFRMSLNLHTALLVIIDRVTGKGQGLKHNSVGDRATAHSLIASTEAIFLTLFSGLISDL
ncbi:hypothetical protein [Streptomyces sedi]|uniref:Uncharacterized protein n=1 Tax=Streptomyces sedi TaxID=555059 RepID=A0A5C4UIX0_9ACTN|nr:hypothetical protein [Streptomyces sedi]TNM23634.1 hypothetical protein FH715_27750 [Streptomyces sedi]